MAYGLQIFKSNGILDIDTTATRLGRIIGVYNYTLPAATGWPGVTVDYPIPNFVDDGTWSLIVVPSSVPPIVPAYTRNAGYIRLQSLQAQILSGYFLILRY